MHEDVFGRFPFLQEFLESENQLTGSPPDISLLPTLRKLKVSSNFLSGCLSPGFEHRTPYLDFYRWNHTLW